MRVWHKIVDLCHNYRSCAYTAATVTSTVRAIYQYIASHERVIETRIERERRGSHHDSKGESRFHERATFAGGLTEKATDCRTCVRLKCNFLARATTTSSSPMGVVGESRDYLPLSYLNKLAGSEQAAPFSISFCFSCYLSRLRYHRIDLAHVT